MAIICRKYKLLFIMVGGTGSTSLGNLLRNKFEGEWLPEENIFLDNKKLLDRKHNTIRELLKFNCISKQELKSYLKFATVRNPFDRYATEYERLVGTWMESMVEKKRIAKSDNKVPEAYLQKYSRKKKAEIKQARNIGFEKWLLQKLTKRSFKTKVMDWLKSRVDKLYMPLAYPMISCVDEIIRYEHLEKDFNSLLLQANIITADEWISIPHGNKTPDKKPYQEYYTLKARELMETVFAKELAFFGYSFD